MLRRPDMLDIQQKQVSNLQQTIKLFHHRRQVFVEGNPTGVDTGVDPPFLGLRKKLYDEIDLQKRFSACTGDAPFF